MAALKAKVARRNEAHVREGELEVGTPRADSAHMGEARVEKVEVLPEPQRALEARMW